MADFLIKAGANIELGASTPLMESAQEGHIELTKYLLQNGADVNAQSGTGDTALTYACENGHTDVSDLLLKYNAVLEHESEGGRTPFRTCHTPMRIYMHIYIYIVVHVKLYIHVVL